MNIDDALLARAMQLSGLTEKTAVVHAGLHALIARASAARLAKLGGFDPAAAVAPRQRDTKPPAAGKTRRRS